MGPVDNAIRVEFQEILSIELSIGRIAVHVE